ncbi:aldehyde dehydrogenase family protein [Streptomyces mirabilis]|uniref:aldehyde dehydrogenase family protein n=1 Tax=Streptomyces mirabilis TaxID=68239 RepID=UPI00368B6FFF
MDSSGSAAPLVQGLVELLRTFDEGAQASGDGSAYGAAGLAVCGHGLLAEHRPDLPVVDPAAFCRDVTNGMRIALEDIFGPVLVVIPYEDDEEAIAIVNDSRLRTRGNRGGDLLEPQDLGATGLMKNGRRGP